MSPVFASLGMKIAQVEVARNERLRYPLGSFIYYVTQLGGRGSTLVSCYDEDELEAWLPCPRLVLRIRLE